MGEAIDIYKNNFKPSVYLSSPYMGVCLNVVAADSDEEANYELSTLQQFFLNVVRGSSNPLLPPVETMDSLWNEHERINVESTLEMTLCGSKDTVRQQLIEFQARYEVNEIMAVTYMYEQSKQIRSYEILKEIVTDSCK